MGRLEGLLDTLASAYGAGATVSPSTTSSRSWARPGRWPRGTSPTPSTPARPAKALDVLHRMLAAGDSHPLVVLPCSTATTARCCGWTAPG